MEKLIIFCFVIGFSLMAGSKSKAVSISGDGVKTSVVYFHYTRRCLTCQAVEDEAKKALQEFFSEKLNSGEIEMKSVNLDEPEGKELAQKLEVDGQTLLIVKGDVKKDLTSKAFMYARTNPDKYHLEIKEAINSF